MTSPMVSPRPRRTAAPAVLALVLALTALAGCGDDSPSPDPAPGPSSSAASSDPSEPTPSEPTGSDTPTENPLGTDVAPADGPGLELESLSLRLPRGWKFVSKDSGGFIANPRDFNQVDYLTAYVFDNSGRTTGLAGAQREWASVSAYGATAKRLDDIEVDGVPMVHMTAPAGSRRLDAFASNSTPWTILLEFEVGLRSPRERQELIDSVLATLELQQ